MTGWNEACPGVESMLVVAVFVMLTLITVFVIDATRLLLRAGVIVSVSMAMAIAFYNTVFFNTLVFLICVPNALIWTTFESDARHVYWHLVRILYNFILPILNRLCAACVCAWHICNIQQAITNIETIVAMVSSWYAAVQTSRAKLSFDREDILRKLKTA